MRTKDSATSDRRAVPLADQGSRTDVVAILRRGRVRQQASDESWGRGGNVPQVIRPLAATMLTEIQLTCDSVHNPY